MSLCLLYIWARGETYRIEYAEYGARGIYQPENNNGTGISGPEDSWGKEKARERECQSSPLRVVNNNAQVCSTMSCRVQSAEWWRSCRGWIDESLDRAASRAGAARRSSPRALMMERSRSGGSRRRGCGSFNPANPICPFSPVFALLNSPSTLSKARRRKTVVRDLQAPATRLKT